MERSWGWGVCGGVGCALCLSPTATGPAERTGEGGGGGGEDGNGRYLCGPPAEYTPSWTIKPEPASESQRGCRAAGLVVVAAAPETDTGAG